MKKLSVVDLKQHAGDLSGEVRVHPLDQREETLAQHLLLLLGRSGGHHGGGERLLALDDDGLLGWRCRGHHALQAARMSHMAKLKENSTRFDKADSDVGTELDAGDDQ